MSGSALAAGRRGSGRRPRAIHHVTNIVTGLAGTTARCFSNCVTAQNSDQDPNIASAGSYNDEIVMLATSGCSANRKIDRLTHCRV